MKRIHFLVFPGLVFVLGASSCDNDNSGVNAITDVAPYMVPCIGGYLDPLTNLCWQDPPSASDMNWYEATGTANPDGGTDGGTDYCDDLEAGGFDDWRLPDIDELISLLRGCVNMESTGDLSLSNCDVCDPGGVDSSSGVFANCGSCSTMNGPGNGGCYWDPALSGECRRYWSKSSHTDLSDKAWYANFELGDQSWKDMNGSYHVRCMRAVP